MNSMSLKVLHLSLHFFSSYLNDFTFPTSSSSCCAQYTIHRNSSHNHFFLLIPVNVVFTNLLLNYHTFQLQVYLVNIICPSGFTQVKLLNVIFGYDAKITLSRLSSVFLMTFRNINCLYLLRYHQLQSTANVYMNIHNYPIKNLERNLQNILLRLN